MVRKNADLILLDLGLPDIDGMEDMGRGINRNRKQKIQFIGTYRKRRNKR